ncbi:AraC family transcriptional regulator [Lapidilactobacillus luobeiensis]|uniref:AraC family transcriptional regulator n=1 Tax=Lapidilactobacillus luobeiensis TaxID=2950371 RepID=UPI0021C28F91|nr:AraC family transcriptional regulator [Lapidilactobacillus luobeiensis]
MTFEEFKYQAVNNERFEADINYINRSRADQGWVSQKHSHPFTELFYVTAGRGLFEINDEIVTVVKNELILISPFVRHTERAMAQQSFEYIVLGISNLKSSVDQINSYQKFYDYDLVFQNYLRRLIEELSVKRSAYQIASKCLISLLLIDLERLTDISPMPQVEQAQNGYAYLLKQDIDTNFNHPLSIDQLAKRQNISSYYACRLFKKAYQRTIYSYILERRLSESIALMKSSDFTISEIARQVGFASESSFALAFKKVHGIAPMQYKKGLLK